MGKARDNIEELKGLVTQAQRSGQLPGELARAFWGIVGGGTQESQSHDPGPTQQPEQGRPVTITLRVTGGQLPGQASGEVERTLGTLARNAGLAVVPRSVSVSQG